jgi:hypothetical protein
MTPQQNHQPQPVAHHHHSHSMSMQQQQGPPVSPQASHAPPQPMYTGNNIQQLAGTVMPEFFGYGGGNGYNPQMQMLPSSEPTSPPQDLNASWYNFMAQYRQ